MYSGSYVSMLKNFPIAISVIANVDGAYIYRYMNTYCMSLFGVEEGSYIGKPVGFSYSGD